MQFHNRLRNLDEYAYLAVKAVAAVPGLNCTKGVYITARGAKCFGIILLAHQVCTVRHPFSKRIDSNWWVLNDLGGLLSTEMFLVNGFYEPWLTAIYLAQLIQVCWLGTCDYTWFHTKECGENSRCLSSRCKCGRSIAHYKWNAHARSKFGNHPYNGNFGTDSRDRRSWLYIFKDGIVPWSRKKPQLLQYTSQLITNYI